MFKLYKLKNSKYEYEGMRVTADNVGDVAGWINGAGYQYRDSEGRIKPTEELVKQRIGKIAMFHSVDSVPQRHSLFFIDQYELDRDFENDQ